MEAQALLSIKAPPPQVPISGSVLRPTNLIFGILKEIAADSTLTLDAFAYDLDEPDIIADFSKIGKRLRIIIDNSGNHAPATSGPSQAAKTLTKAKAAVQRMHFKSLQHNKVLIVKRNGTAIKVLCGSTNFSFNGLYLQSNNTLVFEGQDAAGLFDQYFTAAWPSSIPFPQAISPRNGISSNPKGHLQSNFVSHPTANPDLSLNPVAAAIDLRPRPTFFAIAFLAQIKTTDTVRAVVDRLTDKAVFSYGISDKSKGISVKKPDGTVGLIAWNYLKTSTAPPFAAEFSSGSGIHEHNKFVVTDFNLPTAKVFTGSSNLSGSGEKGNGDHLIMIEDPRVATSYAIQAVLIFDHLHFAANMNAAKKPTQLVPSRNRSPSQRPRRRGSLGMMRRTVSSLATVNYFPIGLAYPRTEYPSQGHPIDHRCSGIFEVIPQQ